MKLTYSIPTQAMKPVLSSVADRGSWRRNQIAVTAASFMGFTGFTLVMPFLPGYIHQLGVEDVGEIGVWPA